MRVALFLPHLAVTGGLGSHCRSLLSALLRTASADDELVVFAPADPKKLFPMSGLDETWRPFVADERVRLVPLKWPADQPLSKPLDRVLAGPVRDCRPDLFYASYYIGMADPPCPQAVTFHDAGFLDFPEIFGDAAVQRREALAVVGPKIDSLICISNDARKRICRLLPFDEARTDVVWHGIADSPEELAEARDLGRPDDPLWPGGDTVTDWGEYLFSPVGAATGFNRVRKNLPAAVAAFRSLGPEHDKVRLLIASTGVLHDKMLGELLPPDELAGGGIVGDAWRSRDDRIRVLPNLDRAPFLRAMARARAVVYPSRYEGFGLPPVEAMALGVPVIAGRATSIPEVCGDAAVLVDPDSPAEFAAAMTSLLTRPERRRELIDRGERRAALFTLDKMGAEMWKVWRRLG